MTLIKSSRLFVLAITHNIVVINYNSTLFDSIRHEMNEVKMTHSSLVLYDLTP